MIILDIYEIDGFEDITEGPNFLQIYRIEDRKKVGEMSLNGQTTIDDELIVYPHTVNIYEEFRRKGIAIETIKQISQNYEVIFLNAGNNTVEDKDDVHYSSEGFSFMQKCVELGYAKAIL